jgi:putative sigma-54 modulation protein
MDLQIRTIGTRVTDGMREYVDGRLAKLDRMLGNVVDAQLELKTEKLRTGNEQTSAQFTLQSGKHILRAEVRDAETTRAIELAIDKLERQVRKFHDKRQDRKGRLAVSNVSASIAGTAGSAMGTDEDLDEEGVERRIVRTKRFAMKPMDVDEAIDQLELLGHDFYLFFNASENQLNVLYTRRDGTYGLLGPATH